MIDAGLIAGLITALVALVGSWLVAHRGAKDTASKVLDSTFQRLGHVEERVDRLEHQRAGDVERLADQGARLVIQEQHIGTLERWIWDRRPPPPPARPGETKPAEHDEHEDEEGD